MNVFVNTEIKKLKQFLSVPRNVAIVTHVNPDGDALASALALGLILKKAGHQTMVISPNEYPDFLAWLPGNVDVVRYSRKKKKVINWLDVAEIMFCLDLNEARRTGDMEKQIRRFGKTIVMIDHHPNPEDFANIIISDTTVSSTAELLFQFIDRMGYGSLVDNEVAQCLLCGIITDTGIFYHNSSNPATYIAMARLLETGVDKDMIIRNVYHNFSWPRMKMLGYCLYQKMVVFPEKHTAYISLSAQELNDFNYEDGDLEGVVNYPLSIKGIYFSAIFIEKSDHVKVSFRSAGKFSVNDFARQHFNGGGHINASGGRTQLPLSGALQYFEQLLPQYEKQLEQSL